MPPLAFDLGDRQLEALDLGLAVSGGGTGVGGHGADGDGVAGGLALELEESSMLPPEQPARDNAITAAALAATNLVENFTFILFLLPWDISTSFICQPRAGCARETFHSHNSHTTELHHTACDRHSRLSHPMFVADCYNQTGFEPAIKLFLL